MTDPAEGSRDLALFEIKEGSDAREFLLAERPALVRGTLYLSLALLGALVVWSCIGRMDVVVTAPGVVRPRGDVQQVQAPPGSGKVSEVCVREGSSVVVDQVILRFDTRPLKLELQNVEHEMDAKRRERDDALESRKRLAQAYEAEKATRETDIQQGELEVEQEKVRRDRLVDQAKARVESAKARLAGFQKRRDELEKKVRDYDEKYRGGAITGMMLEEAKRDLATAKADLEPAEKAVAEAEVACVPDETQVKLAEGRLGLKRRALAESAAAQSIKDHDAVARASQVDSQIVALEGQREAINLKVQRAELRAPVSGVVTRLAVAYAGRVVAEGSTVAEISPSGHELVLEAYLKNSDRGDRIVGRPAKLRFAAFPYQDYGAVDGEVSWVSPDMMTQPADAPAGVAPSGPVFKVTITLAREDVVSTRGRTGRIELGMIAQADIVVDEQPVIFLLMSELKRIFDPRAS